MDSVRFLAALTVAVLKGVMFLDGFLRLLDLQDFRGSRLLRDVCFIVSIIYLFLFNWRN